MKDPTFALHRAARSGDLSAVRQCFAGPEADELNEPDAQRFTPLMHAVGSPARGVDVVRLLIERGARVVAPVEWLENPPRVMSLALSNGDPDRVCALLDAGADIHYAGSHGYGALLDAIYGRAILHDDRLVELLEILVAQGVDLDRISTYEESGLRVLSRIGRFDAVALLLAAGADESQLEWNPLIRAVALGSIGDMEKAIESGSPLEVRDFWERTAWLVALQLGDIAKAGWLLDRGADSDVSGRCGKPSLFYAIEGHHMAMLRWLLDEGIALDQTDDFESTPLIAAVEAGNLPAVNLLLHRGVDVNSVVKGQAALDHANDGAVVQRLLDAGADPQRLPFTMRRTLVGLPSEPDEDVLDVSREEFHAERAVRFGTANPQEIGLPFWRRMIEAGVTGFQAARRYKDSTSRRRSPTWCAQRFGQSITWLPDGRIVQAGGEHEDGYDPDFCIYNDVFVHETNGTFRILGYPAEEFPPTDFHTATRVNSTIYIVGSLGYQGTRQFGSTPVHALDLATFRITRLNTSGEAPGWIYKHRAILADSNELIITGGKVVTTNGERELHTDNHGVFALDVRQLTWRKVV